MYTMQCCNQDMILYKDINSYDKPDYRACCAYWWYECELCGKQLECNPAGNGQPLEIPLKVNKKKFVYRKAKNEI